MYTLDSHASLPIDGPGGVYIYDIVHVGQGVGVISSDDVLRLLDPSNLVEVGSIKAVNKDVNCLECMGDEGAPIVVTAGRDGAVRIWDPRTGQKAGELRAGTNAPILSLSASTAGNAIAAGTELTSHQATVVMWDVRSMGKPRLQYIDSHSDDITELQYHPVHTEILLSGSTDGLVNLYNTTIEDEDEALHQTVNHGASIHHAGFLTEVNIFALSHDEKFSTCQMVTSFADSVEEPPPHKFGDLRGMLGCEYVANVLARPGGGGVVGVGSHSKDKFDLIQLQNDNKWTFVQGSQVTLHDAHGSDIVRSFCFLDKHKIILTGGEDGQVKAWKSA